MILRHADVDGLHAEAFIGAHDGAPEVQVDYGFGLVPMERPEAWRIVKATENEMEALTACGFGCLVDLHRKAVRVKDAPYGGLLW